MPLRDSASCVLYFYLWTCFRSADLLFRASARFPRALDPVESDSLLLPPSRLPARGPPDRFYRELHVAY